MNEENCFQNVTHVSFLKAFCDDFMRRRSWFFRSQSDPALPANGKVSTIFLFSCTDSSPPPKRTYEMMCPMALYLLPPSKSKNLTKIRKNTASNYSTYICIFIWKYTRSMHVHSKIKSVKNTTHAYVPHNRFCLQLSMIVLTHTQNTLDISKFFPECTISVGFSLQ